jgi:hypothetical protein
MVETTKEGGGELVEEGDEGGIDNSFIIFGEMVGPINGCKVISEEKSVFSTEDAY